MRLATRPAHERVDRSFGALDLGDRDDYARFLQAQHYGHTAALAGCGTDSLRDVIAARRDAVASDLRVLGCAPLPAPDTTPNLPHELGIAYVIAGSLHGARVLRRQWERSTDPQVNRATGFMTFRGLETVWVDTLERLKSVPAHAQPDVVVTADRIFTHFEDGLRLTMPAPSPMARPTSALFQAV